MELFRIPADEAAVDFLISALVKTGLFTVLLLLIARLLKRTSSAVRAAWYTTGALAVLSLPVLTSVLPGWRIGSLVYPFDVVGGALAGGGGTDPATVGAVLLAVWGAGVVVLLGRLVLDVTRIIAVTDRGDDVGGPLANLARTVEREIGLSRDVRVILSNAVHVPCTWGVRRPVVLLPAAAAEWEPDLQRAVLHHELAHVARGDYAGLLWLELVRALYWPNPFAWLLHRTGRHEQERACDDAAVRAGIPPAEYARHLVVIGRQVLETPGSPIAALPMVRTSSFRERIASVMEPGTDRRPATLARLLLTGAVIALLAAPVAVASPGWVCPSSSGPASPAAARHAKT